MKRAVFAVFLLVFAARPLVAAELTLTFGNGLVTVDAKDVTVRQILTEWARVGKTRIVNMERVASPPVTIKIERIPEKQALEIILRAVPGYMAAPRPAPLQGASAYDRILIIASTTVAPAPARPPATTSLQGARPPSQLRVPSPILNPGALPDLPAIEDEDDDDAAEEEAAARAAAAAGLLAVPAVPPNMFQPGVNVVPGVGTLRAPVGLQEPQAAPTTPAPTPTNPWNAPAGTALPGPPTPTPQPAARTPAPLRPPQPDR